MIKIKQIGFYAQLVDQGRLASMHLGFSESGAADWQSYELANALVGNSIIRTAKASQVKPINATSIEITLGDVSLQFEQDCFIALTGAQASCKIDDKPCDMYKGLWLKAGECLSVAHIGQDNSLLGLRVYIAVRGGLNTPTLFASAANVKREGSGGLHQDGSALQAGESLALNVSLDEAYLQSKTADAVTASSQNMIEHCHSSTNSIALIPSYQWNEFSHMQRNALLSNKYSVSTQADRMAIRLEGPAVISTNKSLFSQGLSKGAVQCTGDGQLIVMLNDRQTIGGYPVLGAVEAFSRAKLAQSKPGMAFEFVLSEPLNVAAKLRIWRKQIENICTSVDQCFCS